ncbi:MAG: acyl carrier protein [Acidobacteriaceae bacterium]|nr:acyl carrier protein [Acidobacteriaceae bacterium]
MPDSQIQTNNLQDRLMDAFCAIFPERSREEILTADREAWPEWDSLAAITLLTVLQEEFQADIDVTELDQLSSFAAVRAYLESHAG